MQPLCALHNKSYFGGEKMAKVTKYQKPTVAMVLFNEEDLIKTSGETEPVVLTGNDKFKNDGYIPGGTID